MIHLPRIGSSKKVSSLRDSPLASPYRLSAVHDIISASPNPDIPKVQLHRPSPKQPFVQLRRCPLQVLLWSAETGWFCFCSATMSGHDPPPSISASPPAQSPSPESIVSAWRAKLTSWWNNTSASFTTYSQLPQSSEDQDPDTETNQLDPEMEALRLSNARWRIYWLATVLCCGGALFGYDSGVIGTCIHPPVKTLNSNTNISQVES